MFYHKRGLAGSLSLCLFNFSALLLLDEEGVCLNELLLYFTIELCQWRQAPFFCTSFPGLCLPLMCSTLWHISRWVGKAIEIESMFRVCRPVFGSVCQEKAAKMVFINNH